MSDMTETTQQPETKIIRGGMSLDEFIERMNRGEDFEIINGEVVEGEPMKYWHGRIANRISRAINALTLPADLGEAFVEMVFILPDAIGPNWIKGSRKPDVLFISQARMKAYEEQQSDWRDLPLALVPDWVVEIISETDKYSDVSEKVQGYLRDGVKLVWIVEPPLQQVTVYTPNSSVQTIYKAADTLTGGDVLPGFSATVGDLIGVAQG